ncbi:MAG: hypothetical protein HC835_18160 [Oscillatoriales cyanobacterium RM2_1_1]|nr:hypothetical protein [Oscillatoriales cyanobacterium SM2_3_0]NJO47379.1 hypothetical protein [Oscillatoriales cyanobacterium RM2_1_1]
MGSKDGLSKQFFLKLELEAEMTVGLIDEYCARYQSLFKEVRNYECFKYLHLGIISPIKRKSLPEIAKADGIYNQINFPLMVRIFKPKGTLKESDKYQTKIELASEIIAKLMALGLNIELVLVDSLYGEIETEVQENTTVDFSYHQQWDPARGWKNTLNNLRLISQPLLLLWSIYPWLDIFPNSQLLLGLNYLIASMNQFKLGFAFG